MYLLFHTQADFDIFHARTRATGALIPHPTESWLIMRCDGSEGCLAYGDRFSTAWCRDRGFPI
jgi:hypothetical protein